MATERADAIVASLTRRSMQEVPKETAGATSISVLGLFGDELVVQFALAPDAQRRSTARTFRFPIRGEVSSRTVKVYTSLENAPVALADLPDSPDSSGYALTDTEQFLARALSGPITFDPSVRESLLVRETDGIVAISRAPSRRNWVADQIKSMAGQFMHAEPNSIYGVIAQGMGRAFGISSR